MRKKCTMPLGSKTQPCFISALRTWVKVTFFPGLPNTQDLLQRLQAEAPGEWLQAMAWQWVTGKALVNNTHRRISSLPDTLCPLSWLWQPQDLKYSQCLSVLLLTVSSLPLVSHLEVPHFRPHRSHSPPGGLAMPDPASKSRQHHGLPERGDPDTRPST